MASAVYTPFKGDVLRGDSTRALQTVDTRVLMAMTNTTFDTEVDDEFVGDTTTEDPCDGANYARQTQTGEAVTDDAANNRGEFDADDIQFASLGVGTRQNAGLVVFIFIINDAASPMICWIDTGGFPFDGNGGNVDVAWNAEGILQAT